MRRVVALARKELIHIYRDWRTLGLTLVLPLVLSLLMSVGLSLTRNNLTVIVQDLDDSSASRECVDAIRVSTTLHVVSWPGDRQPEDALRSNVARAALIVPAHFGRDISRGVNSPIELLVDASNNSTASSWWHRYTWTAARLKVSRNSSARRFLRMILQNGRLIWRAMTGLPPSDQYELT